MKVYRIMNLLDSVAIMFLKAIIIIIYVIHADSLDS